MSSHLPLQTFQLSSLCQVGCLCAEAEVRQRRVGDTDNLSKSPISVDLLLWQCIKEELGNPVDPSKPSQLPTLLINASQ